MPGTVAVPNRIPWPPILYGGAAIVAVGLGMMVPGPEWLRALVPAEIGLWRGMQRLRGRHGVTGWTSSARNALRETLPELVSGNSIRNTIRLGTL